MLPFYCSQVLNSLFFKMNDLKLPHLLLVAGTGRNTGKTTLVCNIIRNFSSSQSIIAVKITPHFHKNSESGRVLINTENLYLAEETNHATGKDSSRMLQAGASRAYFVMAKDENLEEAFLQIRKSIPDDSLIICESGGLRFHIEPGLFFMMNKKIPEAIKPSAEKLIFLADRVIIFDGEKIDFNPDSIRIRDNQWALKH